MSTLRENQDAVAAIHRLAGIRKTPAESGLARKREQVQQRHSQDPLYEVIDSQEPVAARRRRAQRFQRLPARGDREPMPKTCGKSRGNESGIDIPEMIR